MSEQRSTTREHIWLDCQGQLVSGFVHRPATETGARYPAVLMFHGLMASKSQPPHRLFVKLADELARAGIVSLRIDFRGRGDSEGESVDVTPDGDLSDAQGALDVIARQPYVDPTRIAALGISWGGAIAACLAGRDRRIGPLVMWSSVPGGVLDWNPPLREIDGRLVAELWGNLVGAEFYAGLHRINPLKEMRTARGPLLIVYGTADEVVPAPAVEAARAALVELGLQHEVVAVPGADHVFMAPEAVHTLMTTTHWLRQALVDARGRSD